MDVDGGGGAPHPTEEQAAGAELSATQAAELLAPTQAETQGGCVPVHLHAVPPHACSTMHRAQAPPGAAGDAERCLPSLSGPAHADRLHPRTVRAQARWRSWAC
jgi:hypothetical protein